MPTITLPVLEHEVKSRRASGDTSALREFLDYFISDPRESAEMAMNLKKDGKAYQDAYAKLLAKLRETRQLELAAAAEEVAAERAIAEEKGRLAKLKARVAASFKKRNDADEASVLKLEAERNTPLAQAELTAAEGGDGAAGEVAIAEEKVVKEAAEANSAMAEAAARVGSAAITAETGMPFAGAAAGSAIKNALGKAASKAKSGAKSAAGGVKDFMKKDIDMSGFKSSASARVKPFYASNVEGRGFLWLLFFITLFYHYYVATSGYPLGGFIAIHFVVFIIIVISWGMFTGEGDEGVKTASIVSGIALLVYLAPTGLSQLGLVDQKYLDIIVGFITFLPVWPSYLISKIGGKLFTAYKVILLLLIVFFPLLSLFNSISTLHLPGSGTGTDTNQAMSTWYEQAKVNIDKTIKNILKTSETVTNPGAYYTGQVETNKKAPLGVSIDTLSSRDKLVANDSDIVLYGNVKARSFIGESVNVAPACVIENKKGAQPAIVDQPVMNIPFSTSQTFSCTFPHATTGSYSIKATGTFPFQTWSYITYTFVDEERVRNLARQGKDVNKVLGISEQPVATFTSGPVLLGMGGTPMPILVRADKDPILPPGSVIGITVDSAWETGKVNHVDKVELKVPEPFALAECDRPQTKDPETDDKEPLYTNYVFENPKFDDVQTWSSIRCKITIPPEKKSDALALVAGADKVDRSFIAVVTYTYTIEKRTTVQVK